MPCLRRPEPVDLPLGPFKSRQRPQVRMATARSATGATICTHFSE